MTSIVKCSLKARVLSPIRESWRDLTRDLFDSYRPEVHYMRGPGPKWREKHAYTPVPIVDLTTHDRAGRIRQH